MKYICQKCGKEFEAYEVECDECGGTGVIEEEWWEYQYDEQLGGAECWQCEGKGYILETFLCPDCYEKEFFGEEDVC